MAEIRFESYYGVAPLDGNYLVHHGTKGMKWYHRLYQHQDGSLTPLGRIHYGVGEKRKARTDHGDALKQFKKGLSDKDYAKAKDSERSRQATKLAETASEASDRKGRISEKNSARLEEAAKKAGYNSLDEAIRKAANDEASRKQAKKDKKIENLIKEGNVVNLKRNLNKLSVDDLQKAASKAKSDADKRELLNEIRGEHVRRNQEIKDLKKARREEEIEAAKKKAIESGDPRLIKKYLKNMTTNELQDAINRTEKMLKIESQAQERSERERIIREAKRAELRERIDDVSYGVQKVIYRAKMIAWADGGKKGPKPEPPTRSDRDFGAELKGKAKEVYEAGLKEFAENKAKQKRAELDKAGITNEKVREKEVQKTLLKSLPKSFFKDDKDSSKEQEKALKDAMSIAAKNKAVKDLSSGEGTAYENLEKAKKSVRDTFNPKKELSKEEEDIARRAVQLNNIISRFTKMNQDDPLGANVRASNLTLRKATTLEDIEGNAKLHSDLSTMTDRRAAKTAKDWNPKDAEATFYESPSNVSTNGKWAVKAPTRSTPKAAFSFADDAKKAAKNMSDIRHATAISRAKSLKMSGLSIAEIANRLGVSESTVSEYLKKK